MVESRKSAAETLRLVADQIENGGLDTYGPVIWDRKHGLKLLGATGDFPRGKAQEEDEGGLQIAIETKEGTIVVHFGKPVGWIGLGPDEADALGNMLIERAQAIRKGAH